jgi:DNA polymerase/3'-5' exonuclease PolX
MINEEIADIFERMSRVLAFKGANRFRALAYERAARSVVNTWTRAKLAPLTSQSGADAN